MTTSPHYFVVGGAGFIGGHVVDRLLADEWAGGVTIFDNFSSGREWHYEEHTGDSRFRVVRGDVKNVELLTEAMRDHDVVIHLASNPDIARAAIEPVIDFREGILLTNNVLEAMRVSGATTIVYASGSGVYGDLGTIEAAEDYGPMIPVSTYGASKLSGEALISAYSHMFGLTGRVFRFGNVVGPRQTHGVGYDFLRRLLKDSGRLRILGDGAQSKSYIHVRDVLEAVFLAGRCSASPFEVYNVATGDYITVREIAVLAIETVGLRAEEVDLEFTGGRRGWKGDVPTVRLSTERIRKLGWKCKWSSREALRESMAAMLPDLLAGRL